MTCVICSDSAISALLLLLLFYFYCFLLLRHWTSYLHLRIRLRLVLVPCPCLLCNINTFPDCKSTQRYNPEDHNRHLDRRKILRSQVLMKFYKKHYISESTVPLQNVIQMFCK